MNFIIPSDILGTNFSLLVKENGTYEKCNINNHLLNEYEIINSKDFLEKIKLYNVKQPVFLDEKQTKPYKNIVESNIKIPWIHCVPTDLYKTSLQDYINNIKIILSKNYFYYDNFYKKTNELFYNLYPANIDLEQFYKFIKIEENASSSKILKSFTPIKNINNLNLTDIASYSRISSKTGRLTIVSGPLILHLKKEYRKILKSRFQNGKIYYLDYKSLEPRILLATVFKNKNIPKDIYQDSLNELKLNKKINRDIIKTVLISIINGAGEKEITNQLQGKIDYPEDLIKIVIEYFGVNKLREKLLEEYKNNNGLIIYNHFGRPINCSNTAPYILLNYFIQSTAVDVALLGFNKICNKIVTTELKHYIKPIFVLHDALLLDVAPEIFPYIDKLSLFGNKIEKFDNINFWIELEKIN